MTITKEEIDQAIKNKEEFERENKVLVLQSKYYRGE